MNTHTNEALRHYVRKERLAGCVINVLLAIFFTYLIFFPVPVIPLWGKDGMAFDLVPTVFMLTLVGNLVVTLLARKRLGAGELPIISEDVCGRMARRLPTNMFARLVVVAVVMTVMTVPLSVLLLTLAGIDSLSYHQYLAFKAIYGPLIGALPVAAVIEATLRAEAQSA